MRAWNTMNQLTHYLFTCKFFYYKVKNKKYFLFLSFYKDLDKLTNSFSVSIIPLPPGL